MDGACRFDPRELGAEAARAADPRRRNLIRDCEEAEFASPAHPKQKRQR